MQTNSDSDQDVSAVVKKAQRYNYGHFMPEILKKDAHLISHPEGPKPGDTAPKFSLKDTDGNTWSLQKLQGQPVVLLVGSGTCPVTQGNLPGLQKLYQEYSHRSQWLMLYVREAHPGEKMPSHTSFEQKREQAEHFKRDTGTQWPILVDEVEGTMHKQYGLLPNSVFLIDAEGRVSFVGEISHAPTLYKALEHLFAQNMRGVVPEGEDKSLHMLGPTAFGWAAIERGGEISKRDLSRHMPPLALNLWTGNKMKKALNPLASRAEPISTGAKIGMVGAVALTGIVMWKLFRKRS